MEQGSNSVAQMQHVVQGMILFDFKERSFELKPQPAFSFRCLAVDGCTTPSAPSKTAAGLPSLDRERKVELLQRTLGIKHKLKVYDSMKFPETHEEAAVMMLTRWELEDELSAIEEVLHDLRRKNIDAKKNAISKEGAPLKRKKV